MTISINAAFDSGNIRLVKVDGDVIDIEIVADRQSDFYQWFYFRVAGAGGRTITMPMPHFVRNHRRCRCAECHISAKLLSKQVAGRRDHTARNRGRHHAPESHRTPTKCLQPRAPSIERASANAS